MPEKLLAIQLFGKFHYGLSDAALPFLQVYQLTQIRTYG
jgi:hypothetical protein